MRKLLFVCLGLGLLLPAPPASAKGISALDGQPAVRHRFELRKGRFEIGPSMNFSLNRMLRNAIMVGAKLGYHVNDWLSFGGDFSYGFGVNTGLNDEISGKTVFDVPSWDAGPGAAPWDKVKNRFADIIFTGDIRVAFTPMSGKLAIFGRLFVGYDFYVFGGIGMAVTKNKGSAPADFGVAAEHDIGAANNGFRIGPAFGIGMHLYMTNWFSMGIEFKDLAFSDNESGGDITHGLAADELKVGRALINGEDRKFTNHFFAGFNFTFFLPTTAEISR